MEDRPIKFHLLHKDELSYEVSIRGEKPADSHQALKKQIKELATLIPTDEVDVFEGDITDELKTISSKLAELSELASSKSKVTLKTINRIHTLGNHLYHRLGRVEPVSDNDVHVHAELTDQLSSISDKVGKMFSAFQSSSKDNALSAACLPETTDPPAPVVSVQCTKDRGIQKLNLQYSGKGCVVSFLERISELSASRGISEEELFRSAVELFTAEALFWYRSIRGEVSNWSQLRKLLLSEYLPHDFDYRLLAEIRARTQGATETISNYLSIMDNYFSRLQKPLDEADKLDIVRHNIRPFYTAQLALTDVSTWGGLKACCRLLEQAKLQGESFREPTFSPNLLAPELGFKTEHSGNCASATTNPGGFCVQCRRTGHVLRDCEAPRQIICYQCGEKGVTLRTCPKCRKPPQGSPKNE